VRRARRIAAAGAGGVLLLLVLAQLLLPKIAAHEISSRLSRYGHIASVSVSAWPAIELLWGDADKVRVSARELSLELPQAGHVLGEASGANEIEMTAARVRVGPLALQEASFRKHGHTLTAQATATEAAIASALPPGVNVRLLRSERGSVEVSVGGRLFGVGGEIDAVAQASEGKLIARPSTPLLALFSLTLYQDPSVHIDAIAASATPPSAPARGYVLTMRARLTG
jgi:LmeA-like phospholipid-binding